MVTGGSVLAAGIGHDLIKKSISIFKDGWNFKTFLK